MVTIEHFDYNVVQRAEHVFRGAHWRVAVDAARHDAGQLQVATTVAQEPPFEADELTWAVEASGRLPCELS